MANTMKVKRGVNRALTAVTGHQLVKATTVPSADRAAVRDIEQQLRRVSEERRRAEAAAAKAEEHRFAAERAVQPSPAPKKPAPKPEFPADYEQDLIEMIKRVRPFTMTEHEKIHALWMAVKYVVHNNIPGAFVECGVWRGGSTQAAAITFAGQGVTDRDLYMFDTFEGMPPPTDRDLRHDGRAAADLMERTDRSSGVWAYASLDDVQAGMSQIDYPADRVHYVQGLVEDTIPDQAPDQISILRLDTDWYESTAHELAQLYDRVSPGGVLIIDDYGWWKGSREATDEFLQATGEPLLLLRAGTGRIAIKPFQQTTKTQPA